MPVLRAVLLFGWVWALPLQATGATNVHELEPNDAPAQAQALKGEATVFGAMSGNDQDGYLWTVSDEDARKRWTLELRGIPGRLTKAEVIRVHLAEDGSGVVGTERLMALQTPQGRRPALAEDLLFEPGEYLIGISQAGGGSAPAGGFRPAAAADAFADAAAPVEPAATSSGEAPTTAPANDRPTAGDISGAADAYRLYIREGRALSLSGEREPRTSRAAARDLKPGDEYARHETETSAWYALRFDDPDGLQRWDLTLQAPVGRVVDAELLDADGRRLLTGRSDDRGLVQFADLAPGAATLYLGVEPDSPGLVLAAGSVSAGARIAGAETEPNDAWEQANRLDWSEPLSGRAGKRHEDDYFRFTVDEAMANRVHALSITTSPPGQQIQACLLDARGTVAQCRRGNSPIELPDLVFPPGDWGLRLTRAAEGTAYKVNLSSAGAADPGREAEPNDGVALATGVPAKLRIKGRFAGDDEDHYRFMLSERPQLWRFQAIGDGISELAHFDGAGRQTTKRSFRGSRRAQLENLYLLPGTHTIKVAGSDGDYTLIARPLGPPDPNAEREPNDDPSRTQRLAMAQTRAGVLASGADQDMYRFFLANRDHVRLTIQPPPDGDVHAKLDWYGHEMAQTSRSEPGEPAVLSGVFPPGDYQLTLSSPRHPSAAEYTVTLERLPRFGCPADCEPNGFDHYYAAAPVPAGGVLRGNSGRWGDEDVYALPPVPEPTELVIRSASELRLALQVAEGSPEWLRYDPRAGTFRVPLPPGSGHRLVVDSREADYELGLSVDGVPFPPAAPPFPVAVELDLEQPAVSAYRSLGQRLNGMVRLRNQGPTPQRAALQATTSDYRWHVRLAEDALELAPGAVREVAVNVHVPADAWADRTVRVSVRAHHGGAQAEAWQDVAVDRDQLPVNPIRSWRPPDRLRGGFNVASGALGGAPHASSTKVSRFETLFDGLTFDNNRVMSCCSEHAGWAADGRPTLTVDLAGDVPVPVAGIALNHLARANPYYRIRSGALLLSEDGETFREALEFETLPVRTEQYFELAEPVPARFARLRIDETFHRRSGAGGVVLGEWKVIATPGFDPFQGADVNLADPALGGHVVFTAPPGPLRDTRTLDPAVASGSLNHAPAGETFTWVIGFHDNRAARIRQISWHYPDSVAPELRFPRVDVAVSTESTAGPWRAIGRIDNRDGPAALTLDAPQWARFVRFSTRRPATMPVPYGPEAIRILEAPVDATYRSILGDWGSASQAAIFEAGQDLAEAARPAMRNGSRDAAAALGLDTVVAGRVALGGTERWYRLDVPASTNVLRLTVTGSPSVRARARLEDAAGETIPMRRLPRESGVRQHVVEAIVNPGDPVWIRIDEPPRNIVFSWDTSPSVNAYLPTIYDALTAFSSQVQAGRETINLVPFGRGPLLERWHGDAYVLQTILNDYPRRESSSAAERTLRIAAEELEPLPGSKAVLVISDGRTSYHGGLWSSLNRVAPSVFGIGVGGLQAWNVDVFQDWSSAGGGHYGHLVYGGEMEVAFDRAVTMLRRPADYTLTATAEWREAPGPGSLRVLPAEASTRQDAAVALVLDASGSMLQRLDGERRINIARAVLTDAVENVIPAGTPLALRVFGHREPDACRTDLEIPLGPLDPAAAAGVIGGIRAMNLARTPIAASLAAVRDDLGDAERALIVLVTDGEETCDGDPAAVIESLRASGLTINLNIVGLAIDDVEVADAFQSWARRGGGRYFPALDRSGLAAAIRDALKVPYTVLDADGTAVAQGFVGGEAVALDQGTYAVAVGGAEIITDVAIVGGQARTLRLDK